MNHIQLPWAFVFWTCTVLVAYTYFFYPFLIWALSRAFGSRAEAPPALEDGCLPRVSLVIAAYNEEAVIADRLRNALELDYPTDRLEILVGSDGSRDRTPAIVRQFGDRGVRLWEFTQNRGKATVLNSLVAEATGSILLMSDANTDIDRQAARRLVGWFVDPGIGAAVGRLVLTDPRTGRNVDSLYWRYETFLKRCESRLGALLGANGAIYAIRRELYVPIPPQTIVDDFVIPLLAKIKTDCSIVYDPEALAFEDSPAEVGAEFHRRCRIGAGGFQSVGMLRRLLDPRHGWAAFAFFSHKILRWNCPFFLIGAFISSFLIARQPLYRILFGAQLVLYAVSFLMLFVPARVSILRPLRLTTMFTGMNAALLVGFCRWLSGRQKGTWRRTVRVGRVDA